MRYLLVAWFLILTLHNVDAQDYTIRLKRGGSWTANDGSSKQSDRYDTDELSTRNIPVNKDINKTNNTVINVQEVEINANDDGNDADFEEHRSKTSGNKIGNRYALGMEKDVESNRDNQTPKYGTKSQNGIYDTKGTKDISDVRYYYEYTVKQGDTLSTIASNFRTTPDILVKAVGLNSDTTPKIGSKMLVPTQHYMIRNDIVIIPVIKTTELRNHSIAPALGSQLNVEPQKYSNIPTPHRMKPSSHGETFVKEVNAEKGDITSSNGFPTEIQDSQSIDDSTTRKSNGDNMFAWPATSRKIIVPFVDATKSSGINIEATEGSDIFAAADGVVAYVGNEISSYGELLMIKHQDGYVTVYGHNKSILVKKGDQIKRGQVVAKVGKTGAVKSPQLFFSIRHNRKVINPMEYTAN